MMKNMATLYVICSVLMAALFIISATLQFNDPDWYFWIPLYAGAAYVNLMNIAIANAKRTGDVGNFILCLGQFLLSKVILDDMTKIWSFDMRERVVRERIGSVLVILCMILQISAAASFQEAPAKRVNSEVAQATKYGMGILAAISFGLSAIFLVYHGEEMNS